MHRIERNQMLMLSGMIIFLLIAPFTAQTVRVDIGHATKTFVPTEALGAGIDRINIKATDKLFTEPVMKQVLSAGWQTVSYRQNTELHIEAWHWNPNGAWSDSAGNGYFVGSATPGEAVRHSFGYFLPHRGFTRNDGTDAYGYSRMTDGDEKTYWKSNPYLTKVFTGESDADHPQWVVIDLANNHSIDAIRIAWAEPYAKRYLVQYWVGEEPIKQPTKGNWVTFDGGAVTNGAGGTATLRLAASPMPVRFLCILMSESSNTCDMVQMIRAIAWGTQLAKFTLVRSLRTASFMTWFAIRMIQTRPQPIARRSIPGIPLQILMISVIR